MFIKYGSNCPFCLNHDDTANLGHNRNFQFYIEIFDGTIC